MNSIDEERQAIQGIIADNRLTAHFQPVFSGEGKVFGYEALARLLKEDPLFPNIADLFAAAIRTGTISSLDVMCRENALREASAGLMNEKSTFLFMNICPEALLSPTYRDGITDEIEERWMVSRERIILELTEETAIRNYPLFKDAVSRYRDKGYKIALDDFGIGYGGLKMLSIIRPDFVKIDRHFISDIDRNFVNLAVVESIALLCRRIGMKVIAEGIESAGQFTFANSLGIDLFQGYFMGRPAPASAVFQNRLTA